MGSGFLGEKRRERRVRRRGIMEKNDDEASLNAKPGACFKSYICGNIHKSSLKKIFLQLMGLNLILFPLF